MISEGTPAIHRQHINRLGVGNVLRLGSRQVAKWEGQMHAWTTGLGLGAGSFHQVMISPISKPSNLLNLK